MTLTLSSARYHGVLLAEETLQEARARSGERLAVASLTGAFIFAPMIRPSGPGNVSPVDLFTVGGIVAALLWARVSHEKLRAPYALGAAVMVLGGAASAIVGPLTSSAEFINLLIDLLLLSYCTALVNVLGRPGALRTALCAWCWAGIGWAVVCTLAHFGHISALEGITPADGNRVLFTFGDPNYAASYWDTTIMVVYATRFPARRWHRMVGYGFLVYALVLTESNGGILELLTAMVFILVVKNYHRHGWAGASATVLVIALSAGSFITVFPLSTLQHDALYSGQSFLVNSIGRSDQSTQERSQLRTETFQLYARSTGVFGLGPQTTKQLLTKWQYPYAKEAHDDYLAAISERGVLGAIGLILIIGSVATRAALAMGKSLSPDLAAAVPRPVGIVAAAISLAVAAYSYEVLHFRFVWAIFAIVAILGKNARR